MIHVFFFPFLDPEIRLLKKILLLSWVGKMFSLHVRLVSYTWSTMEVRCFWLVLEHHGRNSVSKKEKGAANLECCVCKLSRAAGWSHLDANTVLALGYISLWICSPVTSEKAAITCMLANVSFFSPHEEEREEGWKFKHQFSSPWVLLYQPLVRPLLCHTLLIRWILRGCWWASTCLDQSNVDSLSLRASDAISVFPWFWMKVWGKEDIYEWILQLVTLWWGNSCFWSYL